jgi:two-component system, NtrC family, sensor kinase
LDLLRLYEKEDIHTTEIENVKATIDLDFVQEDFPKILKSMRMGTERIRSIVNSLRNFSRLDEADLKAVDIHEGIESTLLVLQKNLENLGIELIRKYGDLPLVECYPGQLNQVFFNLISNAIEALEEVSTHRILTICTLAQAQTVSIQIHDTGAGIPESNRSSIFDPFFTTKPVGKGTGLGLSISYQIVTERHQGKLTCQSESGTTFIITIPTRQAANPLH